MDGLALAPRGRPWLTRPSISRSIRSARGESLRYRLAAASRSTPSSALFALIYLLPLFVVVANSFRELPEITQNGLIALPHSFSLKAWPQAWAHYCVAGTCEGIKRNFFNSLDHDHPGDDHLDPARRAQRLRPVEMALSGIGDAVRLHRRSASSCRARSRSCPGPTSSARCISPTRSTASFSCT